MEDNVIDKIIDFVNLRSDIKAAILNGSRVNSNAPQDEFQDYDVSLIVQNVDVFINDLQWIDYFGEIIIKQINRWSNNETSGIYFLLLFKECFRIDFSFSQISNLSSILKDSLSVVLVDKEKIIPKLPNPNDSSYWIRRPTVDEFNFAVNEFFWCLTNVAKGLYREELTYVKMMYESVVRSVFLDMINWFIGMKYDWKVNVGKYSKWVKNYLPHDLYTLLEKSYSGYDYQEIWDSLFSSITLFRIVAKSIATNLNFEYPINDDQNVTHYLKQIRSKSIDKNK